MTFLALTVTETGAVMSQDSYIYHCEPAALDHAKRVLTKPTADAAEAAGNTYIGGGDPDAVVVQGQALKILPLPHLNMAIGIIGSFKVWLGWHLELMTLQAATAAELCEATPMNLRRVHAAADPDQAVTIIHAGFDAEAARGFAVLYNSADGFEGTAYEPTRTIGPPPNPNDPAIDEVNHLWNEADQGRHIERLHRALYGMQWRAFLRGDLALGCGVGGPLTHVEVSHTGIAITMSPEKDGR